MQITTYSGGFKLNSLIHIQVQTWTAEMIKTGKLTAEDLIAHIN